MHTTLFITCKVNGTATSKSVRQSVYQILSSDRLFHIPDSDEGICDWFVIGGRASGMLSLKSRSTPVIVLDSPTALMEAFGQELASRANRFGEEDDARLIDAFLYDSFLTGFEGNARVNDPSWDAPIFWDLEGQPVSPSFIGSKWLVVVDYHS